MKRENMRREWLHEASDVSADDFERILNESSKILSEERRRRLESGLIYISSRRIMVVGDIHGDLESLSRIINDFFTYNVDKIVFLGDYGDRGDRSVEVYYTLLRFKMIVDASAEEEHASETERERKDEEARVILLRGNHEGPPDLPVLPHELPFFFGKKYGARGRRLYERVVALWDLLPHAVFVKCERGGGYLLMHGGVPENTRSVEDIAYAHLRHPQTSDFEEILWNDPMEDEGCTFSMRGAGKRFGNDVTERVLRIINADTLIRSHEPCENGYSIAHNGKILTIFSRKGAPYFNNHAAYLLLNSSALIKAKNAYELASENIVIW
ncbi:MAG: metallophosphoesterase [Canidatus Methanoxibalbensis ujae]|nr:metallophosphoesterase [Candidatus Methanoxibalbensis ujae]MCW7077540.1 metallophosphoesterase [Candidatus Methanoxibalbensis ujae]